MLAWKFPLRNTRQKSPIDIETVNDNIHEFTSEAGNLNEHNWSATTDVSDQNVPVPTSSEAEAALRIHHSYFYTVHSIGNEDLYDTGWSGASPTPDAHFVRSDLTSDYKLPYGAFGASSISGISGLSLEESRLRPAGVPGTTIDTPQLKNKLSWQRLHTLTGNTQSATMWMMCSFLMIQKDKPQGHDTSDALSEEGAKEKEYSFGSAQFALRYNGSIIWESATGTAEPDNDSYAFRELNGPRPITLDAIIPVVSGDFRLELVGRCANPGIFTPMAIVHSDLMAFEFRR